MRCILPAALMLATGLACGLAAVPAAGEEPGEILRIQIEDEAITPVVARFIQRAIAKAEETQCACLIIELDTPGGLLESTQQVVKSLLASRVPVVVYISPAGGRAASAGVFITLASHVAAMAPGSRIGAAHPVQIGGLPIGPGQPPGERDGEDVDKTSKPRSPIEEKLVNDTVAWARGLAELRGRNAEWAAEAVSESRVILSHEAVREGVVELEATDLDDLLEKLDGREIQVDHASVRLVTAGVAVHTIEMWWGEKFLAVISNPNVVLFLLMFGVYGIIFELYSPGWGVAGTLGVVCLVLAFFGLSLLPVNYAGLALIVLGLAMFVAEVKVTSFGTLTIGGIICLILGGMMLVDSPAGFLRVSLAVLIPIAVATGLITVFLLSCIVKAHRGRVQTGGEALLDRDAIAYEKFAPSGRGYEGQVFVRGEWWRARSSEPVPDGQVVRVVGRDGLTLQVEANGRVVARQVQET